MATAKRRMDDEGDDDDEEVCGAIASFLIEETVGVVAKELEFTGGKQAPLHLQIRESKAGLISGGTGGWVWNSSLYLSRWLCASDSIQDHLKNATVIELGCGSGAIPSIVAAYLGAGRVVATDVCADCRQAALENIKSADLGSAADLCVGSLDVIRLDEGSLSVLGPPADVILFADLIYIEELAAALPATLAHLLCRARDKLSARCFGCIAERTSTGGRARVDTFHRGLRGAGLIIERCELPPAIAAGGGLYVGGEEHQHLYEIRLGDV